VRRSLHNRMGTITNGCFLEWFDKVYQQNGT
jgi:hypothetical protein